MLAGWVCKATNPVRKLNRDAEASGGSYRYRVGADSTNALLFVYDQWNLQAELSALNPPSFILRSYVWGLDLTGSLHGAGGVGGLLRTTEHAAPVESHFVAYDGNGNVMRLVKASNGGLSADYEYEPFGRILKATGPATCPIRFSSKYGDPEAILMYYSHRYLQEGRWLSADPLDEQGNMR